MNKSLWVVSSRMYKTFDCVLEEQRDSECRKGRHGAFLHGHASAWEE